MDADQLLFLFLLDGFLFWGNDLYLKYAQPVVIALVNNSNTCVEIVIWLGRVGYEPSEAGVEGAIRHKGFIKPLPIAQIFVRLFGGLISEFAKQFQLDVLAVDGQVIEVLICHLFRGKSIDIDINGEALAGWQAHLPHFEAVARLAHRGEIID